MNHILPAFIRKEFQIERSYRLAFLFSWLRAVGTLVVFLFIDKLFGHRITPYLKEYGVNYFSYILLSLAFFNYLGVGINSFSLRIRDEQTEGTFEALLAAPVPPLFLLFCMGVWDILFATLNLVIYVLAGVLLFKVDFSHVNGISTLVISILTVITFTSLGILATSFTIAYKKGNPVDWILNSLEGILGGVYFPVTVLPAGLQIIAHLLPITYAVKGLQLAVYQGYSLAQLSQEITVLFLFALLLFPLSRLALSKALETAKKNGTLSQF